MIGLLLYPLAALAGVLAALLVNEAADRVVDDEATPPRDARACRRCGAALPRRTARDLLARRRCPACGAYTSWRRAGVTVALAVCFPLLLAHLLAPETQTRLPLPVVVALLALALAVLAFIFVVDLEHHLILNVVTYPAAAALLAVAALANRHALPAMLVGAALAGGLFLVFYVVGVLIYRQEALGFGDVKLAVVLGLLLGWPAVASALLLTALFAAAGSVLLLGLGAASRRTYIPFGTFLTLGAAFVLLQAAPIW